MHKQPFDVTFFKFLSLYNYKNRFKRSFVYFILVGKRTLIARRAELIVLGKHFQTDTFPSGAGDIDAGAGMNKPLWSRSDNSFRFNFLADSSPAPQEKAPEAAPARISFTGQSSNFVFNFQIPPTVLENELDMDTKEGKASLQQEGVSPPEPSAQAKAKKKKKSEKKKVSDAEAPARPAEGGQGDEEQSAEEQLNRQLDWCIEQLELGLRSQKGTPKQKEEASRALKTLRSSKAPLVKKRQVMRVMAGDYRKKMEEEKSKQFRLIQSEVASAQVKVVSDRPKKSIFHRRAEGQTKPQEDEKQTQVQEETSSFVFVPSKEEFCFNFF